ncbi:MAG: hypothetical protein EBV06_01645 [Planctomycetia bacterium]|nr:hypothetical protein [Planctomycetia bacterium]
MPNARLRFRQIYLSACLLLALTLTTALRGNPGANQTVPPAASTGPATASTLPNPESIQTVPKNTEVISPFFPNSAILGSFPPLPAIPAVPEKPAKPSSGPGSVAGFVEGVSGIDAGFEVLLGQGRILTLRDKLTVPGKTAPVIAVADPSVADFVVISPRQLRIVGKRIGMTDLSVTTADDRTYSFEIRVVADLPVLTGQLRCLFPDASIRLSQIRDHIVVEGQARDAAQVNRILETVRVYLTSIRSVQVSTVSGQGSSTPPNLPRPAPKAEDRDKADAKRAFFQLDEKSPSRNDDGVRPDTAFLVSPEYGRVAAAQATVPEPRIINLLKVPGSKQVLLKVRVAELNRTALREIGADLVFGDPKNGSVLGTQIGGGSVLATGGIGTPGGIITNRASTFFGTTPNTTVFGIFEGADVEVLLRALRRNALLKLLAEPNLVALNGHQASFLAGGEFPVPIPQTTTGGAGTSVTVTFKEFGVRLGFLPTILDGEMVRMSVDPEVSSIDFSIGTVIVPGGTPVPGLNTRKSHTTVELRQGQTLAIAGLLQLTLEGQTTRVPGLGDLPIIGPFFSNTSSNRMEKELVVLVTPYLVEPMNPGQVPPAPGDEVKAPNDLEFYLLNRLEGRTGRDWRATTKYDDPLRVLRCLMKLEDTYLCGPHGFGN